MKRQFVVTVEEIEVSETTTAPVEAEKVSAYRAVDANEIGRIVAMLAGGKSAKEVSHATKTDAGRIHFTAIQKVGVDAGVIPMPTAWTALKAMSAARAAQKNGTKQ